FTGPNSTNAMSCASGTIAVGEAFHTIREGRADVMLAGGAEAPLAPMTYAAFSVIRAMSTRNDDPAHASRPFDEDRDGFVMGEGAAVLVLEERARALARGARVYAERAPYALTNDPSPLAAPRPSPTPPATWIAGRARAARRRPTSCSPTRSVSAGSTRRSCCGGRIRASRILLQPRGSSHAQAAAAARGRIRRHSAVRVSRRRQRRGANGRRDHRRQHRLARRRPGARRRHGDHRLDDDEHLRQPHKSRRYVR